jgi:exopolysaccharide/PEP-CTERM locus tyrosine autokinase
VAAEAEPASEGLLLDPRHTVEMDFPRLRKERILPSIDSERRFAEQYRHLKRPLLAAARNRTEPTGRLIMVASAHPDEGKTFTAMNLAISIAREPGVRVLLVDADTPKGHLTQLLDLRSAPGLLDLLMSPESDINLLVHRTSLASLMFLPCGQNSSQATELLGSSRMAEFIARLCREDPGLIVIADTPPLLQTSESQYIAQIAGEVLFVVRAETTLRQDVVRAIGLLDESTSVSLVLNQAHDAPVGAYYYGEHAVTASDVR